MLSCQPAAPAGRALLVMVPGQQGASPEEVFAVCARWGAGRTPQACKQQGLTHLSHEEKVLRRKLKDRVATQTARNRKKAQMSELKQQVVDKGEENQKMC